MQTIEIFCVEVGWRVKGETNSTFESTKEPVHVCVQVQDEKYGRKVTDESKKKRGNKKNVRMLHKTWKRAHTTDKCSSRTRVKILDATCCQFFWKMDWGKVSMN